MAGVREDEIAALVGLGIAFRSQGLRARDRNWLQVVRHRVAVSRIAIPRLESDQLADLLPNEATGKGHPGIEAAVVADLEDELGLAQLFAQRFALLHIHAERFF